MARVLDKVLEGHWWLVLAAMRLLGFFSHSGWPPRASRAWTMYARVMLVVTVTARIATFLALQVSFDQKKEDYIKDRETYYVTTMFSIVVLFKTFGSILAQVALQCQSRGLNLLYRALLVYSRSYPPPRRPRRIRKTVVLVYGMSLFVLNVAIIYIWLTELKGDMVLIIVYQTVTDLMPSQLIMLSQDSVLHVMVTGVDLLEGVADDVQVLVDALCAAEQVASPIRTLFPDPNLSVVTSSMHVRALRQRYQRVIDAIKMHNRVYGGFQLVALPSMFVEGVVCLYASVVFTAFRPSEDRHWSMGAIWAGIGGTNLVTKMLFMCYIGEHVHSENSRISTTLQDVITSQHSMEPRIRNEVVGFLQQIHMQETRFGVFDLIHFDMSTLTAILASFTSYLVALNQFSAILKESKNGSL